MNQRNLSVGWTAVHYAAYEGHADVLRMLLAHGAVPDLTDAGGDTPEVYAAEWENNECITIIREAIAMRAERSANNEDYLDSDEKTVSEDSEEEEDESSMMNWVMPQPVMPNLATQTKLVNNLINNQFTKTVENLTIETTKSPTPVKKTSHIVAVNTVPLSSEEEKEDKVDKVVDIIVEMPPSPNPPSFMVHNLSVADDLDDLVVGFESSVSLNVGMFYSPSIQIVHI